MRAGNTNSVYSRTPALLTSDSACDQSGRFPSRESVRKVTMEQMYIVQPATYCIRARDAYHGPISHS